MNRAVGSLLVLSLPFLAWPAFAKEYVIKMVTHQDEGSYAFEPNEITIKAGDTVSWINAQDDMHNVMSEAVPRNTAPFESPILEKKGQKWSHTFTVSGTYRFHCHPHVAMNMRGIIVVDRPSNPAEISPSGHQHDEDHSYPPKTVPVSSAHAENAAEPTERKVLYWYDPMVPGKRFDKPGRSPFMDMDLVPKYADEGNTGAGGRPIVSVSAGSIQKMNVRTKKTMLTTLGGDVRATGIIMANERTRRDLFSQVEGRVDELEQGAPGDQVEKGDLFYTLYSPELLTLQNDYLSAVKGGYKDIAAAAARRMKLLGVDEKVLHGLSRTQKPFESVPFYVPADGILDRLEIHQGYYLKINDPIGRILDLSVVWVEAAVPETDLPKITKGDTAKITVSGDQATLNAVVDYIYPSIDAQTRTGKVRLVVQNRNYLLKPDGYATVQFATGASERLTVPSSAVLRSSRGDHVIVALGGGKFQARAVQTGIASGELTEILQGLSESEEVVTNGQFLIDSESNLNESLDKLSTEGGHARH